MTKIIGVRFRRAGKVYFFAPGELDIKKGDNVIVETARGIEYGQVVSGIRDIEDEKIVMPLKPVIRIATEEDDAVNAENRIKEKDAYKRCLEKNNIRTCSGSFSCQLQAGTSSISVVMRKFRLNFITCRQSSRLSHQPTVGRHTILISHIIPCSGSFLSFIIITVTVT